MPYSGGPGGLDKYTQLKDAEVMFSLLASNEREFAPFSKFPRPVMLGEGREGVKSRVKSWFKRIANSLDSNNSVQPHLA